MKVILLERIARLGQIGDIVRVKDGYARNFLLPKGKALRATAKNEALFDTQRSQYETRNLELKSEAEKIAQDLNEKIFVIIRSAGETGHLYGSVAARNIAEIVNQAGFSIDRGQIELNHPIKSLGIHSVSILLHPEVSIAIHVNIARSTDDADKQMQNFLKTETPELEENQKKSS